MKTHGKDAFINLGGRMKVVSHSLNEDQQKLAENWKKAHSKKVEISDDDNVGTNTYDLNLPFDHTTKNRDDVSDDDGFTEDFLLDDFNNNNGTSSSKDYDSLFGNSRINECESKIDDKKGETKEEVKEDSTKEGGVEEEEGERKEDEAKEGDDGAENLKKKKKKEKKKYRALEVKLQPNSDQSKILRFVHSFIIIYFFSFYYNIDLNIILYSHLIFIQFYYSSYPFLGI